MPPDPEDDPRPRRGFLASALAGAAGLAAAPFLTGPAAAAQVPASVSTKWDDSWTRQITGKYRAVLDSPRIEGGAGVFRTSMWLGNYHEMYGLTDQDLSAVLVIRHEAIPMVMNNEFWATYGYAKRYKKEYQDFGDALKRPVNYNPFLSLQFGKSTMGIEPLIQRGVIVLGCGVAFGQAVADLQKQDQLEWQDAEAKARTFLVPGVTLQPSGIFAVSRAQDAGCSYVWAI